MKWDMMKLGDVVEKIGSGSTPKGGGKNYGTSGFAFVRSQNVLDYAFSYDGLVYIDEVQAKKLESTSLEENDILLNITGDSVARACTVPSDVLPARINQHVSIIRCNNNLLNKNFLLCYLVSQKQKLLHLASVGATRNALTKSMVENLEIPLPPLEEQKRIAAILDKAHSIRQKRQQNLENADALIKSVFLNMFGDPEVNSKSWNFDFLSNHLKVIGGYAFKSNMFTEEGIPILRIGNINLGHFSNKNLVFWPEDEKLNKYLVFPGDLLMSLTGTVGKDDYGNVCIMDNTYQCYYLNQRNAKLELLSSINRFYLKHILQCPQIKRKLTDINRGVRQANISNSDILNLSIPLPPINLQNKFAEIVQKVEAQKVKQKQHLHEADQAFKALQQQFFG